MSTPKPVTVILVDDERLTRNAVARELRRHPRLEVVGEASDAAEGEALACDLRPDVVLMDVMMPGLDPFVACERIAERTGGAVKVLHWTGLWEADHLLRRGMLAGTSGFHSKGSDSVEVLAAAIIQVAEGGTFFSPAWEERRVAIEQGGQLTPIERLTPNEVAAIKHRVSGKTTAETAEVMGISDRAVQYALKSARTKLSCQDDLALGHLLTIECVLGPEDAPASSF